MPALPGLGFVSCTGASGPPECVLPARAVTAPGAAPPGSCPLALCAAGLLSRWEGTATAGVAGAGVDLAVGGPLLSCCCAGAGEVACGAAAATSAGP